MPRILPRLLQKIASQVSKPAFLKGSTIRPPNRKSLRRRLPVLPSFSSFGRKHSILLDPVNPILNRADYVQHKSLPPRVRVQKIPSDTFDNPRSMTTQERSWWSSPYLRMLSSPLRLCSVTSRYLPSDFLIRLAPFRIPSPRSVHEAHSLLPDGLEHHKFKHRKSGSAIYIICWKSAIQHLTERGSYKRHIPNVSVHSLLDLHISHLLRVRVLQELKILADRLQTQPRGSLHSPVLRRLTRAELDVIKTTGTIPYKDAAAVLIVPPLNRNPVTKTRPKPYDSPSASDEQEPEGNQSSRLALPLSILHPIDASISENHDRPSTQVPLYHGVTLFPSRRQRAALHACLLRLLSVEQRARFRQRGRLKDFMAKRSLGDQKASHAFLLCSDAETCRRADAAATAIALWRVRMWEGSGWEEGTQDGDGWSQIGQ